MPDDKQPFTEEELAALAREHGKPVRAGFENDVLEKVRSRQREKGNQTALSSETKRRQELEDVLPVPESPEQDLEK